MKKMKKQKSYTVYHIGKNLVPAICTAKPGNCPFGGKENHFTNLFQAEKVARRIQEGVFDPLPFMQEESSKVELTEHHAPEEFFSHIRTYITALKKKKKNIEKTLDKGYHTYLEECAKDGIENVISREKFTKSLLKKIPDYKDTVNALAYKEQLLSNSEKERSQTNHFLKHLTPLDQSYSVKTTSAYFVLDVNDWESAREYLDKHGYSYQVRPNVNLKDNFEIRFANHAPYKTYGNKNIDIWKATKASILVDYKTQVVDMEETNSVKESNSIGKIYTNGIPTKKFKEIVYKYHRKDRPTYDGEVITKDNIYRIAEEINARTSAESGQLLQEANILRLAYQSLKLEGKPYEELQEESLRRRTLAERS